MSALDRVMSQADEAAANHTGSSNVPATQRTGGTAVASTRPSLDSMMDSSGISVDGYLTLKYDGMKFGDKKGLFDEVIASITIPDIVPIAQVRATANGSTQFIKSYDGETTSDGTNFARATEALRAAGNAITGPYQTSEVPFTVLEDVILFDKGKEADRIEKGTVIGTTPPLTGVKYLAAFLKKMRAEGHLNETVKVRIKHVPRENSNKNQWGLTDFEFLGVIEDSE